MSDNNKSLANRALSTPEFLAKLSFALSNADTPTIKDLLLKSVPSDFKLLAAQLSASVPAAFSWFELRPNPKAKQHPITKELKTLGNEKWVDNYKYFKAQESNPNNRDIATYAKICCSASLQQNNKAEASQLFNELEAFEKQELLLPSSAYGLKFYTKCLLSYAMDEKVKACAYAIAFLCSNLDQYPPKWITWAESIVKSCGKDLAIALSGKKVSE